MAIHNDDPDVDLYQGVSSAVCTAVSYAGANDPVLLDPGDAGGIFHHGTLNTIVSYDLAGQVCLFTQSATDLVVDVRVTCPRGAFRDDADVRLLDTRRR